MNDTSDEAVVAAPAETTDPTVEATEATQPALEVGSPFFLDGRRCAVTETSPLRTRFAAEGFSGTCATAEIVYDADFGVFHLPGRLHRPVRATTQGALTPVEG